MGDDLCALTATTKWKEFHFGTGIRCVASSCCSTIAAVTSFEPLDIDEANAFVEESIRGFLAERLPAHQITHAHIERVRDELRQRLVPDGALTDGQRFESIVSDGERVGRVWFATLQDIGKDVYICDISIEAERRREGHARAAIELILDHASRLDAARVGLTVAQTNGDAIALYESLGFVTGKSDAAEREMWAVVGTPSVSPPEIT